MLSSTDPRTGQPVTTVAPTTSADVEAKTRRADAAARDLETLGRDGRAAMLDAMAAGLDAQRDNIVDLGTRETALPEMRMQNELNRTVYQLQLFAAALRDGGYLEATIDHPGATPMGPRPDLRRMLVPIGPVAVFGASNFPLAFSVPGGDTASALAAGCPVVVKGHDAHAGLSRLTADILIEAARSAGAPDGTIDIVFGLEAGAALVADPRIRAVGFTGSLSGGRALMDIISRRDEPIPFYGELSSLNPVVISEGAAAQRTTELATEMVTSVSGSGGQLCTKPGVVLVPASPAGDSLVATAFSLVQDLPPAYLLSERIRDSFDRSVADRTDFGHDESSGSPLPDSGFAVLPSVVEVTAAALDGGLLEETFGPTAVVVRYEPEELSDVLRRLPGSLTATIHTGDGEDDLAGRLADELRPVAGRLLFSGWPTGVHVTWAQHHGGPWPSTTTQYTSVGQTAMRRFLRPVTWQEAPDSVLPVELRDDFTGVPRRVDGILELAQGQPQPV